MRKVECGPAAGEADSRQVYPVLKFDLSSDSINRYQNQRLGGKYG